MSYCPLCEPQIGISDDGKWVIVRFYPSSEIDLDSLMTRTYELETGMHIIREGWFKGFEQIEETLITYEQIHAYEDWEAKHVLDNDDIQKEIKIVEDYI